MKHTTMTNERVRLALLLVTAMLLGGCSTQAQPTLYQVATLRSLQEGAFDGQVTCGELRRHGDLGIGTFEGLDGEMVVLDGRVYRAPAQGPVRPAADSRKTPFASVVFFRPQQTLQHQSALNVADLEKLLDLHTPSKNLFYAVRIDGTFSYAKTRSVPRQSEPYPRLLEATRHQNVFEFHDVKGTVVGFYCPAYVGGMNLPGWHLHFITADRTGGGHVLELAGSDLCAQLQTLRQVQMTLPTGGSFYQANMAGDASKELEKAEK
jgi:acetolactate decarboxylase